jgi:hypothetical protein
LAETQEVWTEVYGRSVTTEEAVEMLTSVRRLTEVLMRTESEGGAE